MTVADDLVAKVVEALSRDLRAWGLDRYLYLVHAEAANAREIVEEPLWFAEKVVEDVQQDILDEFIDTTWPRCPRHRRHPLWYHDGAWVCEQDGVSVATLGELPAPPPDEQPWRLGSAPLKLRERRPTSAWSWRALRVCGRIGFVRRPAAAGRAGADAPAALRARSSCAFR